jgi:hypothetical protein
MGGSLKRNVREKMIKAQQGERHGITRETARGVTLVETMIAVLVALIGVFGLGSLIFQATVTNKNQGTEVTRATIYAQDKMEKLLSFGSAGAISTTSANYLTCTQAKTSQPTLPSPNGACNSAGIGTPASGWSSGLVPGGAVAPIQLTCPSSGSSVGYIDFLDASGNQFTGTACSAIPSPTIAYVRMWQIVDQATTGGPALKQVSVAVYSKAAIATTGGTSSKPVVMLTSYMSNSNSCGATEKAAGCPL